MYSDIPGIQAHSMCTASIILCIVLQLGPFEVPLTPWKAPCDNMFKKLKQKITEEQSPVRSTLSPHQQVGHRSVFSATNQSLACKNNDLPLCVGTF